MSSLQEQDRTAHSIRIRWQGSDIIQCLLYPLRAVAGNRRNHHAHWRTWNLFLAPGIATVRKIRNLISPRIRMVNKPAISSDHERRQRFAG